VAECDCVHVRESVCVYAYMTFDLQCDSMCCSVLLCVCV